MKRRNKFLVIVVLVIGALTGKNAYYEATKDNLVLDELAKIEYEDTDNLFAGNSEYVWYDNINNYAYTIKEDNLTEEYYKYLQENNIRDRRWLIYDLITNAEYCHRKKTEELDECYISEDTIKFQNNEHSTMQYELGIAIIESTNGQQAIYGTTNTEVIMEAIGYAYIISQGPTTSGYEEAMEWSYATAQENGYKDEKEVYASTYYKNMAGFAVQLELLSNMSLEEIVGNYDEYYEVIAQVSNYLKIVNK